MAGLERMDLWVATNGSKLFGRGLVDTLPGCDFKCCFFLGGMNVEYWEILAKGNLTFCFETFFVGSTIDLVGKFINTFFMV